MKIRSLNENSSCARIKCVAESIHMKTELLASFAAPIANEAVEMTYEVYVEYREGGNWSLMENLDTHDEVSDAEEQPGRPSEK